MTTRPEKNYNERNEANYRRDVARQINKCQKRGEDIILPSPNGTRFKITVADDGTLSATAL